MNKRRIAMLAIGGGLFIFVLKVAAYLASNSVALLSDAMESIINIVASVMMFTALTIASRSEDELHRYGHQKAENISALIEGVLIIVAAVLILEASVGRLFEPVPFRNLDLGLIISLGASALNMVLATIMMREARKSRSMALEGDAKHLFSDVLSSVGVVIGLFVASLTGWFVLDPIIAIVVAALLIKMGIDVFRKTTVDLMDASCEDAERTINAILDKNKAEYLEYHDLKTRRSGDRVYMEVHICMSGEVTLSEAHSFTVRLEEELQESIPGLVPNIHIEDQTWCVKRKMNGAESP